MDLKARGGGLGVHLRRGRGEGGGTGGACSAPLSACHGSMPCLRATPALRSAGSGEMSLGEMAGLGPCLTPLAGLKTQSQSGAKTQSHGWPHHHSAGIEEA